MGLQRHTSSMYVFEGTVLDLLCKSSVLGLNSRDIALIEIHQRSSNELDQFCSRMMATN